MPTKERLRHVERRTDIKVLITVKIMRLLNFIIQNTGHNRNIRNSTYRNDVTEICEIRIWEISMEQNPKKDREQSDKDKDININNSECNNNLSSQM